MGYKVLCSSVVYHLPKVEYGGTKINRKYASRLLSFVAHIIFRVPGHVVTKFKRLYPYFRCRPFQRRSVTSGLCGRHIYFRYNATFGCVCDNVVGPGDMENVNVGVGILFSCPICWDSVTSGLAGRHIYFRYNTTSVISSTTPLNK